MPTLLRPPSTHLSILRGVQALCRHDWGRFFERYQPIIQRWFQRQLGSAELAEELTQQLMTEMPCKLQTYQLMKRDGGANRFRSWLRAVVRHEAVDSLRQWRMLSLTDDLCADSISELERELLEAQLQDSHEVSERVRQRVEPTTWAVYELAHLHARPAKDVAALFGKSTGAVHTIVSRTNTLLHDEYLALLKMRRGNAGEKDRLDSLPLS